MPTMEFAEKIAYRARTWERWFDRTLGEAMGWRVGWCPLHDPDRKELGSGEYNFANGTYRCSGKPRCHNRRGMSLSQLADEMIHRGIGAGAPINA